MKPRGQLVARATSAAPSAWHRSAFFEASPTGAEAAGAAVLIQLKEWDLASYAERGEHVAATLVSWLACHGPGDGRVGLMMRYSSRRRELLITAADGGTMLPVFHPGDALRATLAASWDLDNGAERVGCGRRLWCLLGAIQPWQLRYTWNVPHGYFHPVYSYDRRETREEAEDAATSVGRARGAQTGPRLVAVEIRGPTSEFWEPVWGES